MIYHDLSQILVDIRVFFIASSWGIPHSWMMTGATPLLLGNLQRSFYSHGDGGCAWDTPQWYVVCNRKKTPIMGSSSVLQKADKILQHVAIEGWRKPWSPIVPMTDPYVCHIWFAIYHQYTSNVSIYIPYMDPMGHGICFGILDKSHDFLNHRDGFSPHEMNHRLLFLKIRGTIKERQQSVLLSSPVSICQL